MVSILWFLSLSSPSSLQRANRDFGVTRNRSVLVPAGAVSLDSRRDVFSRSAKIPTDVADALVSALCREQEMAASRSIRWVVFKSDRGGNTAIGCFRQDP